MSKRNKTPTYSNNAADKRRLGTDLLAARYSLADASGKGVTLTAGRASVVFAMHKSDLSVARRDLRASRLASSQAIADRAVQRRFLAREREHERGIRAYWAFLKARVRQRIQRAGTRKKATGLRLRPVGQYRLPTYNGPVIDAKGRRGVFMSVEYVGARRSKVGVARRMIVYITRDDGVERDDAGELVILSNVGKNPDEQAMAFELVEVLNRSARGNGKLFFTMIVNLPHDVDVDTRRAIVEQFCEEAFGAFDLPYCAALHEPSEQGDQRNKHAHIVFALRPLRRTGDHEWEAGRELLTEHDNRQRFFEYRKLFAQIMTEEVQKEGKGRTYTHLSNAGRGLKAESLEKLGATDTKLVRQGETVAKNERNKERLQQNELQIAKDRSRRRQEAGKARRASLHQAQIKKVPEAPGTASMIAVATLPSSAPPTPAVRVVSTPQAAPAGLPVVVPAKLPTLLKAPPVRSYGAPVTPGSTAPVKAMTLPLISGPNPTNVRSYGLLPPAIVPQGPVRVSFFPSAPCVETPVHAWSAPEVGWPASKPLKSQAEVPSIEPASPPVQASAHMLELIERLARAEAASAERRKKAEARRMHVPPDLGPSR